MKSKIQTLKGFRDFLPQEKKARDFVMAKIVKVFEQFGFEPLETPTLEYASLLLGKYGDEADKLVYTFTDRGDRQVALKYDQTVPTARVLAQYQDQLPKLFRRYQIQNVYRADKPQKGRYREFTQCDIDIFGTTDPLSDSEILACTYKALKNIGFPTVKLTINFRPSLVNDFKSFATEKVSIPSILQSLDKLDKLSPDQVIEELANKGMDQDQASQCVNTIKIQVPEPEELALIRKYTTNLGVNNDDIVYNRNLVRGLDYYTGMIFEVIIPEFESGSCGGGGRYDQLIKQLDGPDIPAVGVAFGFDRIIQAANQLNLIPQDSSTTEVLVTVFDQSTLEASLKLATKLRQQGTNTQVYPQTDRLPEQLSYASQQNIPFVAIIGPDELSNQTVTIKNMASRDQQTLPQAQAVTFLTQSLSS